MVRGLEGWGGGSEGKWGSASRSAAIRRPTPTIILSTLSSVSTCGWKTATQTAKSRWYCVSVFGLSYKP